ncbi:MAG TPA: hypothetical protein VFJ47_07525, partial [Terriglobales bacterium]|nr:hypothetical protein [Terriglobales bacterium]
MTYFQIDKILLGWLALAAAQVVAGMLVPVHSPMPPHALEWMLVSDFLIAAVLGIIAARSDWVGWRLALALVIIAWAINLVDMIEGTVFLKQLGIPWRSLILLASVTYILVLPLWRYIFAGGEAAAPHYSPFSQKPIGSALWRFAVSDLSYLVLYFGAGTAIFPYVRSFYAAQTSSPPGAIMALQLLLRGPVFVLICLLLVRMIGLPRWPGALSVGLAFTILSGVAPLLTPNPYFPEYVRWVDFGEIT